MGRYGRRAAGFMAEKIASRPYMKLPPLEPCSGVHAVQCGCNETYAYDVIIDQDLEFHGRSGESRVGHFASEHALGLE